MKVICIKTEFYISDGKVSIIYGNVYSVTNVYDTEEVLKRVQIPEGVNPANGNWYELEGLGGLHHESNFIELPENLFKTNEFLLTRQKKRSLGV